MEFFDKNLRFENYSLRSFTSDLGENILIFVKKMVVWESIKIVKFIKCGEFFTRVV